MSEIGNRLKTIQENLSEKVTLVAVSKTKPIEDLQEAYNTGQRDFGENKVASIIEITHLIHGVDSERLLKEINKRASQKKIVVDCLIQVHIAEEETKFGFNETEVLALLTEEFLKTYSNVRVKGLMGMATFTNNQEQVKSEFESLNRIFYKLKSTGILPNFDTLSMGMSGDYPIAIEAGSTMIRVGSKIFGSR